METENACQICNQTHTSEVLNAIEQLTEICEELKNSNAEILDQLIRLSEKDKPVRKCSYHLM